MSAKEKLVKPNIKSAKATLAKLAMAGIDLDKVTKHLEIDGVANFEAAWLDLMNSVKTVATGS